MLDDAGAINSTGAQKSKDPSILLRLRRRSPSKPYQAARWSYLRAAQAYMLISMPTGTSTIFGVFQAISFSQVKVGASLAPRGKLGLAFPGRKLGW
ncbi:hypothetical protein ABIB77_000467 [Bradyrhizobium sp. i1.14.1]